MKTVSKTSRVATKHITLPNSGDLAQTPSRKLEPDPGAFPGNDSPALKSIPRTDEQLLDAYSRRRPQQLHRISGPL